MFDPKNESTKILIEKYKALYELAMKEQDHSSLSTDQIKAIGKRIFNESLETAMNNQKVPEEQREGIVEQFEVLIRKECPDMLFETPLIFNDNGFSEKD